MTGKFKIYGELTGNPGLPVRKFHQTYDTFAEASQRLSIKDSHNAIILHRLDGPAIDFYHPDGTREIYWYIDGWSYDFEDWFYTVAKHLTQEQHMELILAYG